jgi:hypothetical protein
MAFCSSSVNPRKKLKVWNPQIKESLILVHAKTCVADSVADPDDVCPDPGPSP